MALVLKYREVAQRNIDEFHRVGAFNGAFGCMYHYPKGGGLGCAIGICDDIGVLRGRDRIGICSLVSEGTVETDNRLRLNFIQAAHDYAVSTNSEASLLAWLGPDSPPESVVDLVRGIRRRTDLTPDVYKEIMRRLAAEPVEAT